MAQNGPPARSLSRCMKRARSSLPVPLSPLDEHWGRASGDLARLFEDPLHDRTLCEDLVAIRAVSVLDGFHGRTAISLGKDADRVSGGMSHHLVGPGWEHVIDSAEPHGGDGILDLRPDCEDHDPCPEAFLVHAAKKPDGIHSRLWIVGKEKHVVVAGPQGSGNSIQIPG